MTSIGLKGLKFYAFHGFYPEEQKTGNHFIVDISVNYDLDLDNLNEDLDKVVDYGVIYNIVNNTMQTPQKLLETVGSRIIKLLYSKYPLITEVDLKIKKIAPPFGGICSHSELHIVM